MVGGISEYLCAPLCAVETPYHKTTPGFIDADLISDDMITLQKLLHQSAKGKSIYNYGLLLRWSLALNEIARWTEMKEEVRERILTHWVD